MITNVLLEHSALVPGTLALTALVCAALGYAALRRRRSDPRALWALAGVSLLGVLALTLTPTGRTASGRGCTVQFSLPSLGSVELLANVALFLPLTLFAALATRRPLVAAGAAVALSVVIETGQALLPAIGRACDTNDGAMNAIGALTGAALAVVVRALAERPPRALSTGG